MSTSMAFTASGPLYVISPVAGADDLANQITARQQQLSALLAMTYGEQGDAFRMLSTDLQDSYMWACEMIACEIQELTSLLQKHITVKGRADA